VPAGLRRDRNVPAKWVRDKHDDMGLLKPETSPTLSTEISSAVSPVPWASKVPLTLTPGLMRCFYNAWTGFTLQYPPSSSPQ